MKQGFVSAAAVLICCAILAMAGVFGYSRYKAGQVEDAAFQAQLQNTRKAEDAALGARMPAQLPTRATTAGGVPAASPHPSPP